MDLRDKSRSRGCKYCGGRLHQANYPRKPRGSAGALSDALKQRLALCCGSSSCRRRTLRPSVRFLGRRVYLGIIVVLAAAFRQGANPTRVKILTDVLGADRRTIERWCRWWRETFQQSSVWRQLRGLIFQAEEPPPRRFVLVFDAEADPKNQARMMSFLCGSSP